MVKNDQSEDLKKLEGNLLIIGNKEIKDYVYAIVDMFAHYNHIIIHSSKGKIDKTNTIIDKFKWCADEDKRRYNFKVTKEYDGKKIRFDAVKIRMDLFPTLKVRRE
jgi:hypothetical protein